MIRGILAGLIALAPPEFRERHGEELLLTHVNRASERRGFFRRILFGVGEAVGTVFLVLRLRLEPGKPSGVQPPAGRFRFFETSRQDLRFGLRTLRRNPGFSVTVILVLALGIGATTGIFSAANAFFFRPLPFQQADRLVRIFETNPEFGWTYADAAPANALDWREQVAAFEDLALYTEFSNQVTFLRDGEPELLNFTSVTGNFFDVLGVRPALGRGFRWEETWLGNDAVIVLSHAVWESHFGADPGVIGRSVDFPGGTVEIVGVMPPEFRFPDSAVQVWTPWGWDPANRGATWFRRAHWVKPVARLADGISAEEASAQLEVVVQRLQSDFPETNSVMGAGLMPFRQFLVRDIRPPVLILLGAVGLLLVLACTNVANLMLIRATDRSKEVALRFALGAGRMRVARMMLTESLILALTGGGVGLALGWAGVKAVGRMNPLGIDGATEVALDHRVLLFALGVSILSGILVGVAPAFRATMGGLVESLKEGGRGGSMGRGTIKAANALVVAEVSLSLVLVLAAGLLIRSFLLLRQVDPGFTTEGTLAVQFTIPATRYGSRDEVLDFYDEFLLRLEGQAGIVSAGSVGQLPLNGTSWSSQFQAEGWPPDRVGFEILHRRADEGYFETLGIPLIRGRLFSSADGPDDPLVVVVNETFAREHFPDEDPLGQRIAYDRAASEESTWYEIIGIVGDQHQVSPGQPPRAEVFENRSQDWGRNQWVVVRTERAPEQMVPNVRAVLREMDPGIALASTRPLRTVWRSSMAREEFLLALMVTFGVVALLLACVGVYGVTTEAARKRTQEIGIRVALGARRHEVIAMMLGRGMTVVGVGLLVGIAVSVPAGRALSGLLFGVAPLDPATMVSVAVVLGTAAFGASYLPARKATAMDPVDSLRAE